MLKNRYHEIHVGLNVMSLIRGLISINRNLSTLLIDDKRFGAESYPSSFVSELEILALQRLGKQHDIPELVDIRKFLSSASIQLITTSCRLQLGKSSFENLRELLRKYPELVDSQDLDVVYSEGEKSFNEFFQEEVSRFEATCYSASKRPKGLKFEVQGPRWFKGIYQKFCELVNLEYATSKDLRFSGLLHLMGISHEDKMKTRLSPEEFPYYFLRLISPMYRLQDLFLVTQLKRRLIVKGGDIKESMVQFWQLHEGKFENLLLASFEGVISGERVLFFSHLPVEVPFSVRSPYPFYRKTQMTTSKRAKTPFPPTNMVFLSDLDALGSERPYRAVAFDGDEMTHYQWPYLDMAGSKAEFYDRQIEEAFNADAIIYPYEKNGHRAQGTLNVSIDLREMRESRKSEAPILTRLPLQIVQNDEIISGFEYWGPFRYKSMGLLALCYGVEGT